MYESTQHGVWMRGIDLAREADFKLSFLRVRPARCEICWDGGSKTLQRRVTQVLVALAHARDSVVSQEDLVNRCWRGLSVSDDAIYRCISILRKVAASFPNPPFAIEGIPGVGYRLTSPTEISDEPRFVMKQPGKISVRPTVAVAGLLIVLILVGAALWIDHSRNADPVQSTLVAVQPFETLSRSESARTLARRIPNEIVSEFGDSQIKTVLDRPGAELSSEMAGLIVTGLMREDSANVVANVRIEDGASRMAIWSMEFKRARRQAQDLPLEVAARVADMVNMANFARTARPPLTDTAGLSALLQTTDMIRDAQGGTWARMLEKARSLVDRHPDFAFGHSVLASAYLEAADSIDVSAQAQTMRNAARQEALRTLTLDPHDAGAYGVLEGVEPPYNFARREVILMRGLKIAKHPKEPLGALYSYQGTLLSSVGRLREALSFQLIARATDEWGPPKTAKLVHNYANVGNLDAAKALLRQAVRRWPNHSAVRSARLYIAAFCEQPAEGLAMLRAIDATVPADEKGTAIWRQFIEAKATRSPAETSRTVALVRKAGESGNLPRETEIMMLAGLDETELAMAVANSVLDQRRLDPRFLFTPVMHKFRQSPDFVGLAARMELIKYWRETGKRPDFCSRSTADQCSSQLLAALQA